MDESMNGQSKIFSFNHSTIHFLILLYHKPDKPKPKGNAYLWRNGVLEKWSIGEMEYWRNGVLEY
jgi:hypothetical protein